MTHARMKRPMAGVALLAALAVSGCATMDASTCGVGESRSVSDVLYFGTDKPAGGSVSAAEWSEFLQAVVTPRFPRGLTVWQGSGQWLGADGSIVREPSYVVSLLHPADEASEKAVVAIATAYKTRFAQEAVLRVRSDACVSY